MAILSIDQGTTGTTALIFSDKGKLKAKANVEFPQHFPRPGWVEHNPKEIWTSVKKAINRVVKISGTKLSKIKCIGITNQRETVVAWDRQTHLPLHNAIVWQCRRTSNFCDGLKSQGHEAKIKRLSGLVVDAYFSGSKIHWLLKNVPEIRAGVKSGRTAVGTIDSFLVWKLTGGVHATDVSNASRTQLMNLKTLKWDNALCDILGVPKEILPEILPSSASFGVTKGLSFLPDGIPICGIAGDQQAALFGQAGFRSGDVKCTYGTGSFILMNTGAEPIKSKNNLLTTVGWQLDGKPPVYALEGGAFICGAAVQWLRDQLKIVKSSSDIERLALEVDDSGGVEFVPALTGLGAPYWDQQARGLICGLTRGSHRGHIARATLEAMALQNAEIFLAMQGDLGKRMRQLKVDGGASANNLLMQTQADYSAVKTIRPKVIETTAAGAAFLAGLGCGLWSSTSDIESIWQEDRVFSSNMTAAQRKKRMDAWTSAVKRALS